MTNGGVLALDRMRDIRGAQLHRTRGELQFSVPGSRAAMRPRTWSTNSGPHRRRDLVRRGRLLGVDHDLGDAVPVTQVKEDELAQVAAAIDPAGHRHDAAGIGEAWVGAGEITDGRVHGTPMVRDRRAVGVIAPGAPALMGRAGVTSGASGGPYAGRSHRGGLHAHRGLAGFRPRHGRHHRSATGWPRSYGCCSSRSSHGSATWWRCRTAAWTSRRPRCPRPSRPASRRCPAQIGDVTRPRDRLMRRRPAMPRGGRARAGHRHLRRRTVCDLPERVPAAAGAGHRDG